MRDDGEVRGFGILRECWKDIRERRGPAPEEPEGAPPRGGDRPAGVSLTEEHRRRMEEMFRQSAP